MNSLTERTHVEDRDRDAESYLCYNDTSNQLAQIIIYYNYYSSTGKREKNLPSRPTQFTIIFILFFKNIFQKDTNVDSDECNETFRSCLDIDH